MSAILPVDQSAGWVTVITKDEMLELNAQGDIPATAERGQIEMRLAKSYLMTTAHYQMFLISLNFRREDPRQRAAFPYLNHLL